MFTHKAACPWLAGVATLLVSALLLTTTTTTQAAQIIPREYAGLPEGGYNPCVRYWVLREDAGACTNLTTLVPGISAELCETVSGPLLALYSAETSRNVLTARVMGPQVVVLPLSSCQVVQRVEATVPETNCDRSNPPHTSAMYGLMSGMMPGQYVLNVTLLYTGFSYGKGKMRVANETLHVLTQTITVLQGPTSAPRNLEALAAEPATMGSPAAAEGTLAAVVASLGEAEGSSADTTGDAGAPIVAMFAAVDSAAAAADSAAANSAAAAADSSTAAVVAKPAVARKLGGIDLVALVNRLAAAKNNKTASAAAWGQLSSAVGNLTKTPSKPPPSKPPPSKPPPLKPPPSVQRPSPPAGGPSKAPVTGNTSAPGQAPADKYPTFHTGDQEPCTYCDANSMAAWPICNTTQVEGSWLSGLESGYTSLPPGLIYTANVSALRWQPKGCRFKPLSSLNLSACLGEREKVVCFVGDSQTRFQASGFIDQVKYPYDTTAGTEPYPWTVEWAYGHNRVRYILNTWGTGWVDQDIAGCTHVIFNFGQWPLSHQAPSRWSASRFARIIRQVLFDIKKYKVQRPETVFFWQSINPRVVDALNFQCSADLDSRLTPFVDLFNSIATELMDLYGIPKIDSDALTRHVPELTYDGTHFQWRGAVGHHLTEYLANVLCVQN